MRPGVVDRPDEAREVDDFLASASTTPCALVVEGEPGIGKTTLWLAAVEQARERGFLVLSARPAQNESVLAYSSLADLLGDVDDAVIDGLPELQRLGLDHVLVRTQTSDTATDLRAVAAGFLSVTEKLADATPVLIAIDDLQWLDPSSVLVAAFAARRLTGPVGILATVRVGDKDGEAASWLQLPAPDAMQRVRLRPMSLGSLHVMLSDRLGRTFPRPTMLRILDASGGNPFYALELARAFGDDPLRPDAPLPSNLAELVYARVGGLDSDADQVLLAAACIAAPTTELVAEAAELGIDRTLQVLDQAEDLGIVSVEGNRVRFAHPLLARGVYTRASAARRRGMHGRLAEVIDEPEVHARHLALSTTTIDARTLESLDIAAAMARNRGAPAAAAELLDMAIRLGGDSPQRRMQLANHQFNSGNTTRARTVLEETIAGLPPGALRAEAKHALAAVLLSGDSFLEAAPLLESVLDEIEDDIALRVQALLSLGYARMNVLALDAAADAADEAVAHARVLGDPSLLSQSLSVRTVFQFMRGEGLHEEDLRRALDLHEHHPGIPIAFRPDVHNAMLMAWSGRLDEARDAIQAVHRRCVDDGEESELMFVAFHSSLIAIWRGDYGDAALIGDDTAERSAQMGGDVPLFTALAIRGSLAAYAGEVDNARRIALQALEVAQRCGSYTLAGWPLTSLGFVEVSIGDYEAALRYTAPLTALVHAAPEATEIFATSFVPDAVEAMVRLGRFSEAETLGDIVEANGRRLDRPWMLAIGARARSMVLTGEGDIDGALLAAEEAMTAHDRLPMPFERARTQLLLGQLQRKKRRKEQASATLREALAEFERMGIARWAERVRAELGRTDIATGSDALLTPSEQRVAELAATGMTNREVAAHLFISPKTVEANLSRIYRKLDIHSRAELGGRMRVS